MLVFFVVLNFVFLLSVEARQGPRDEGPPNIQVQKEQPFFLHIPKTGGTSIEDTLYAENIYVGKWFFLAKRRQTRKRPYTDQCDSFFCPRKDCKHCSGWHCPPRKKIPGSFTVVRNPYERMYSQFLFSTSKEGKLTFTKTGLKCDCTTFRKWATLHLKIAAKYENHQLCHFIPQFKFARRAVIILRTEHLSADFNYCVSHRFKKTIETLNFSVSLNERKYESQRTCRDSVDPLLCIQESHDLDNTFQKFYAKDFTLWREANCRKDTGL